MSGNCKACKNLGCAMRGTDWTPNPAIKCFGYMPQTNYDRLISKTPEELAEWVTTEGRTFGEEYEGYMSVLDWLKTPLNKEGG